MAYAMLDDVLTVVDEALITVNDQWRVTYANRSAERAIGLNKRALVGRPLRECVPELYAREDWHRVIEALKRGEVVSCETISPMTGRWVQVHGAQIQSGWVLYLNDIDARKHAEQELVENEQRFRALFDQAGVGMLEVGPQGHLLAVNDRFCAMTRYSRDELLAMQEPVRLLTHAEDLALVSNAWQEIESGKSNVAQVEKRHVRKDGSVIWDQMTFSAIRDGSGEITSVMAVFQEITDLKRTQAALAEARECAEQHLAELQAVVSQMVEGVMILKPDGTLISMNEAGLRMHDFDAVEQLPARYQDAEHLLQVMDPETEQPLPHERWPVMRALRGEAYTDLEVLVENVHTGRRWVGLCNARPIMDSDGQVRCVIITGRDITEKKQWEQRLQQFNQVLEQRVAERTAEAERRAEQLKLLTAELTHAEQRERRRLAQLLHDDLQQLLVAAKMRLTMTGVGASSEALGEAEELLQKAIETSRSLSTELAPPVLYDMGLVSALEWLGRWVRHQYGLDVELEVDADDEPENDQLQILMFESVRELLLNVVKHARTGAARVRFEHADAWFRLSVEDYGQGFNPAVLERAARSESFGLFSMEQRIELAGGRLTIESEQGVGTRVTIALPASAKRALQEQARDEEQAAVGTDKLNGVAEPERAPAAARVRVLLTDDHEVVRRGLAEVISQAGDLELVGEAATGEEAVVLAERLRPDVAVMDISLPGISGIEATRRLTRRSPNTRVVGLSIHEEQDVSEAMRTAGGATCLSKAKPAEALIRTIRQVAQEVERTEGDEPMPS